MEGSSVPMSHAQMQCAKLTEIIQGYVRFLMQAQEAGVLTFPGTSRAVSLPPRDEHFASFDFFCAEQVPAISIERYIARIVTYMRCSSEVFIFALAYLRRLVRVGFPLHARSVHRVFLTAMVVAAKVRDDHYYSMRYYAQMGGVSLTDLNMMELRFLADLIDFDADVRVEEYRQVMRSIATLTRQNAAGSTADAVSHRHHRHHRYHDQDSNGAEASSTHADEEAARPSDATAANTERKVVVPSSEPDSSGGESSEQTTPSADAGKPHEEVHATPPWTVECNVHW